MRKTAKFCAFLLFAYFILMLALVCIGLLAEEGFLSSLVGTVIGSIPFGNEIGKASVQILGKITGAGISTQKYVTGGGSTSYTALQVVKDFSKMCLNSMVFAVLKAVVDKWIDAAKFEKGRYWLIKVVWHLVASVLCALIVNVLLSFAFTQLQQIQGVAAGVLSTVITLLATGGGMAVALLLAKAVTTATVLACLAKVIFLNIFNLAVTQVALIMILIAFSEKLYLRMTFLFGGWVAIMVILVAAGMMLDSVISPEK